jgi:hypothetical protein
MSNTDTSVLIDQKVLLEFFKQNLANSEHTKLFEHVYKFVNKPEVDNTNELTE